MLGFRPAKSVDREIRGDDGPRRQPGRAARGRRGRILYLERLEVRITPSTATWNGAGSNSNWSTAANWSGGAAPQAGYDLIFPAGATSLSAVDDFPAGTSFSSIT